MELRYFRDGLILILGGIAALEVGSLVASASAIDLILAVATVGAFGWVFWAGKYWWTPVLTGATLGGTFYVGFKVQPLDIAVLLAAISLFPMMLLSHASIYHAYRKPLTIPFYALALFIPMRMGFDLHAAHSGLQNVARVLFEMEWPFFFGWLFYHYGKTSVISAAVVAVAAFTALRVVCVIVATFGTSYLYIPGLNYVMGSPGEDSIADLRGCGYFLMLSLLLLSQVARSRVLRGVLLLLSLGCVYLVLLGGSRLAAATIMTLPIAFFMATRRWIFLGVASLVALSIFFTVNFSPEILDKVPDHVARSLSGFLIKPDTVELGLKNESSTKWHSDLREEGYRRWTTSLTTFAFGDDVKPFREDSYYALGQINEDQMQVSASADVAAYESGLWTVLGTLGALGYILYLLIFIFLWTYTIPYLCRNRVRTIKDGVIFWGTYSSILWFVSGFASGSYPSLELALMIIAAAAVQDNETRKRPVLEPAPWVRHEVAYA